MDGGKLAAKSWDGNEMTQRHGLPQRRTFKPSVRLALRETMHDQTARLHWLRWSVIAEILFLCVQYELGVAATVAGAFPTVPPAGISLGTFSSYVVTSGGSVLAHAVLGILILADASLTLVLALFARVRWIRITALVEFIFVLSAAAGGFLFVVSGFTDDSFSYQMSTGFLVAFVFTFLSLYVLRNPEPATPRASPS